MQICIGMYIILHLSKLGVSQSIHDHQFDLYYCQTSPGGPYEFEDTEENILVLVGAGASDYKPIIETTRRHHQHGWWDMIKMVL